jgi:uncharacterized membrane protein
VVLLLALIAGAGGLLAGRVSAAPAGPAQAQAQARRLGHRIFLPVLLIPLMTVIAALFGDRIGFGE